MKKSAFLAIVSIVVLVLCCTMVTYAFMTNKDAVTVIELISKSAMDFTLEARDTGASYTLAPATAKTDNSQTSTQIYGSEVRIPLKYEVTGKSYANMYVEVSGVVFSKQGGDVPADSADAQLMTQALEFAFAEMTEGQDAQSVPAPAAGDWHGVSQLTNGSFHIGAIDGGTPENIKTAKGYMMLFIRLKLNGELAPPVMNGATMRVTLESAELDAEP